MCVCVCVCVCLWWLCGLCGVLSMYVPMCVLMRLWCVCVACVSVLGLHPGNLGTHRLASLIKASCGAGITHQGVWWGSRSPRGRRRCLPRAPHRSTDINRHTVGLDPVDVGLRETRILPDIGGQHDRRFLHFMLGPRFQEPGGTKPG